MVPAEIEDIFCKYINPLLAKHGGIAFPLTYENNVVTIRLGGACSGCLSANETLNNLIKDNLVKRCRKYVVDDVVITEDVDPEMWKMVQNILRRGKNYE
ncbi:hypothetical protein SDC9_44942 [bioreactor metagenome]|uniref:NIF system FeS cluster assembly NifU C-terminal domain-containing protein n=1 Tax=bioreactor metagenome TaxID=1076179 RepID=A0A644W4Q7_9ZZZZ